jgi:superfamily II DNA/RNA helicase
LPAAAAGAGSRLINQETNVSQTFADLGLPHELVSPLRKAGITEPFPIQAATIPDALDGRDVLGRAPTGSGKTLAFGLPLLATLEKAKPRRPTALVLSPTRELAEQIRSELAPVAAGRGLRLLTVYGGVSYHPQRTKLKNGVDLLIACPGRLIDLIEQGDLTLDAVRYVVIDEADRMADMGFMPQVRRLLEMTPADRQTVLFSATLDGDVARLTERYQTTPVRHEVRADSHDAGDARHHFWRVEHSDRLSLVANVVGANGSTLVFTRTRRGADRLARQLGQNGVKAEAIHGGRSQRQRDRALRNFKNGQAEALIATDVAARGIHVDGVECVVHFDPPEDHKAYLHRSGRTARAGAGGHVVSLVQRDQVRTAGRLQDHLGLRNGISSPVIDDLLNGGGERLGKRSDSSPRSDRPQSRGGRSNGGPRRSSNSGGRSGQGNNRNRSRSAQGGNPNSSGNGRRRSAASDRDGNRHVSAAEARDGNRRDPVSDRDGNKRSTTSNGQGRSGNSDSGRDSHGSAGRGSGGSRRSNGGAANGNRRRKPGSSGGGRYQGGSSGSRSGQSSQSRSGSGSQAVRRRKPSGNHSSR